VDGFVPGPKPRPLAVRAIHAGTLMV
jgi:hypothetical protein